MFVNSSNTTTHSSSTSLTWFGLIFIRCSYSLSILLNWMANCNNGSTLPISKNSQGTSCEVFLVINKLCIYGFTYLIALTGNSIPIIKSKSFRGKTKKGTLYYQFFTLKCLWYALHNHVWWILGLYNTDPPLKLKPNHCIPQATKKLFVMLVSIIAQISILLTCTFVYIRP